MVFPPDFTYPHQKVITAHVAAQCIAGLVSEHRAVVQAGGCSGLWPLALAHYFDHVYTFEPAPTNFRYLQANIVSTPNISARECALGDTQAWVGLTRPKPHAGIWRVSGDGEVLMEPLDDVVGDEPIDAIVLDVEGSEVAALRGAERVITTHRPLLWFEYLSHTDEIDAVLAGYGYAPAARGIGGDCYSVHRTRVP